uniref:High mobility group nucleosome-binding domain-containing protein 3 n=1 Tax=Panthera leo TaxID=9689 RepID=A0A8C8X5L6_PANLE
MSKRKSPENTEGKDGSKPIEQETTRQSARLSAKPAPPKAEPEPRKTSANKEPGTKTNKGTKRKEGEQEAGKEDTAPFQTKAEKAQKREREYANEGGAEREGERESQAGSILSTEPYAGLEPMHRETMT